MAHWTDLSFLMTVSSWIPIWFSWDWWQYYCLGQKPGDSWKDMNKKDFKFSNKSKGCAGQWYIKASINCKDKKNTRKQKKGGRGWDWELLQTLFVHFFSRILSSCLCSVPLCMYVCVVVGVGALLCVHVCLGVCVCFSVLWMCTSARLLSTPGFLWDMVPYLW